LRPPRADIAAPELPGELPWIGDRPPRMPLLTARGPVLVHFFDFAQLNSVRALQYVNAWHERYVEAGLTVLGVHSPRFPFTGESGALALALGRLGVRHPVADDSDHALWHAYGCEGWPSLFLWGKGGALAWFHFGEGEYGATEEAIQTELRTAGHEREIPETLEPLRPTDAPGVLVAPPSEEVFPGGSPSEPWTASAEEAELEISYAAGGAYVSVDGAGVVERAVDGMALRALEIQAPGLYELVHHPRHEAHSLRLRPTPGVRVWSVSFAAGLP
jgi:hypothetical protein